MYEESKKIQTVIHEFDPIYDEHSRILVLGTMPSPKSREQGFYYSHPRNRFWPVLSAVYGEQIPDTVEGKVLLALRHQVAIWDVLKSCEIKGADDSTIQNPVANNLTTIVSKTQIEVVFTTGLKADGLYKKFCYEQMKIPSICLPSTSPANCKMSWEDLVSAYSQIVPYTEKM